MGQPSTARPAQSRRRASPVAHAVEFFNLFGDPQVNPYQFDYRPLGDLMAESPNFGSMIPPSTSEGDWLSIRVANIQNWNLNLSDSKYINLPAKDVARHSLADGDLIMARAIASEEHLGKCVVIKPGKAKWAFDSHLMRIRVDRKKAEPVYIRDLLRSDGGRRIFLRSTRRTTVQFNINTKEIKAMGGFRSAHVNFRSAMSVLWQLTKGLLAFIVPTSSGSTPCSPRSSIAPSAVSCEPCVSISIGTRLRRQAMSKSTVSPSNSPQAFSETLWRARFWTGIQAPARSVG